jgi:hypothetical protein
MLGSAVVRLVFDRLAWAFGRAELRAAVTALVVVGGVSCPTEASAFCRSTTCTRDCPTDLDGCKTTGEKLFWPGGCVGFSLQEDSSVHIPMKYFRQVASRSFVAWSELDCDGGGLSSVLFSELDEVACNRAEYNTSGTNANVLLFQDTKWAYSGDGNTLAKTTVTFDSETGEIFDADIEINHANNDFTINDEVIDYDLEAVLTHEVGHFIGLDHSPDFAATMYAAYEPGTLDQRTLEPDDVLAACAAYPPSRDATCDPKPRGGLGYECGGAENENDLSQDEGPGCSTASATTRSDSTPVGLRPPSALALLAITALLGRASIRRRARRNPTSLDSNEDAR